MNWVICRRDLVQQLIIKQLDRNSKTLDSINNRSYVWNGGQSFVDIYKNMVVRKLRIAPYLTIIS